MIPTCVSQEPLCGRSYWALRWERRLETELWWVPRLPETRLQPSWEEWVFVCLASVCSSMKCTKSLLSQQAQVRNAVASRNSEQHKNTWPLKFKPHMWTNDSIACIMTIWTLKMHSQCKQSHGAFSNVKELFEFFQSWTFCFLIEDSSYIQSYIPEFSQNCSSVRPRQFSALPQNVLRAPHAELGESSVGGADEATFTKTSADVDKWI